MSSLLKYSLSTYLLLPSVGKHQTGKQQWGDLSSNSDVIFFFLFYILFFILLLMYLSWFPLSESLGRGAKEAQKYIAYD